jgi:phosphomannomutase
MNWGKLSNREDAIDVHIGKVLEFVDAEAIRKAALKVVVDGLQQRGGLILPPAAQGNWVATVWNWTAPRMAISSARWNRPRLIWEAVRESQGDRAALVSRRTPDADRLAMVSRRRTLGEDMSLALAAGYIWRGKRWSAIS